MQGPVLQKKNVQPTSSSSPTQPSSFTPTDGVGQTLPSNCDPHREQPVGQPLLVFPSTVIPPLLLPSPLSMNPAPLGRFLQQATPHCSLSVSEATCNSSVPEQEPLKGEGFKSCDKTVRSTVEKPIPTNATEKDQKASAEYNDGKEGDASVEIVESSNQKVISIHGSDREKIIVIEPPQEPVSREGSTAGTETSQQNEER